MPAQILDGLATAKKYTAIIKQEFEAHPALRKPHLYVLLIGTNQASTLYVQNKVRACEGIGFISTVEQLPIEITQQEAEDYIQKANNDPLIDAILVQLPLPSHINTEKLLYLINPDKDADGLHPVNLGKLVHGNSIIKPCTPSGIITLLQEYSLFTEGKHVVILGRSIIVGKTMSLLFMQNMPHGNATVTVCHSKTIEVEKYIQSADILIVAIGKANSITASMVKENSIIIDVGINKTEKGITGDCAFQEMLPKVHAITPVPKGIGPMTIYQLLYNTFILWKKHVQHAVL